MNQEPRPSYETEWEVEDAFSTESVRQKVILAAFVLSDASHALQQAKDRQMEAFEAYTKNAGISTFQVITWWGVYAAAVSSEQSADHSMYTEAFETSETETEMAEQALHASLNGVQQVYNLKKRQLKRALRMSQKLSGKSLSA